MFVPGWEDSTTGNMFTASLTGEGGHPALGDEARRHRLPWRELVDWYPTAARSGVGFFQIGGGIAGDFPICVVPMIEQDLRREVPEVELLLPDQRLHHQLRLLLGRGAEREDHLGQARQHTPSFMIESDATICRRELIF
jgi:deoxyhypusine synthase